jgi:hypothetical protein
LEIFIKCAQIPAIHFFLLQNDLSYYSTFFRKISRKTLFSSPDQVDERQQDDGTEEGDQKTSERKGAETADADEGGDPNAEERSDQTDHDVGKNAHALVVFGNQARDPTRKTPENNP